MALRLSLAGDMRSRPRSYTTPMPLIWKRRTPHNARTRCENRLRGYLRNVGARRLACRVVVHLSRTMVIRAMNNNQ
eukprot:1138407-Lingulodinium_polyedra.AAC.1